jgi:hypothetical protein
MPPKLLSSTVSPFEQAQYHTSIAQMLDNSLEIGSHDLSLEIGSHDLNDVVRSFLGRLGISGHVMANVILH